jgi:hypothetical protein
MSDTSPSAFPGNERQANGSHWQSHLGMTLRDYFAAQALPAMILKVYEAAHAGAPIGNDGQVVAVAASKAYLAADAMLAARLGE